MLWLFYNLLFAVAFVLFLPKFLWRMKRRGGYARDFGQRLGFFRPEVRNRLSEGGWIWIHAVSVGEIFVGLKVAEEMRLSRPDARFVISTTTSTGHAIAQERIHDPDMLIYFPVDFPPIIRRVYELIRPSALILVEGEFWPNLVRAASRRQVPVFLVNGRISEKSHRGYRKLKVFTKRIFRLFECLCVQSEGDRQRLLSLLAPEDRIYVMNSAKYEVAEKSPAGEATAGEALAAAGVEPGHPILLGGSTWPGEEAVLLDTFVSLRKDHPDLTLVLAPRHVERRAEVLAEIESRALRFSLRSESAREIEPPDVLVIDTTGELSHFYAHATVIFIGKSLCASGGQNIIEPAVHGKPIVVGPHMSNFPVVLDEFLEAGAIRQVPDAASLASALSKLLADPDLRAQLGQNAARLVRQKSGAIRDTVEAIAARLNR